MLKEATAGGLAGVVGLVGCYPLTVVKTRLQSQDDYDGPIDCALKISQEEGLRGLFSGFFTSVPRAFATNFVFYFFIAFWRPYFGKRKSVSASMFHGIVAGICVQLVMVPAEMVNTQMIVDRKREKNLFGSVKQIWKRAGFLGFYKGILPALLLTLNPGITNLVKNLILPEPEKAAGSKNFWTGAVSKAIASISTYPIVVAKVQLFTKEEENGENVTSFGVLGRIIKERGILGIYRGTEIQVGTAVLKEAILNATKNPIANLFK